MKKIKEPIDIVPSVWYSKIIDYNFNIVDGIITFHLNLEDSEKIVCLEFQGVTAFDWSYDFDKSFGEFCDIKRFAEFTGIFVGKTKLIPEQDFLEQYAFEYNISIEIRLGSLLIKADKILLDDVLIYSVDE